MIKLGICSEIFKDWEQEKTLAYVKSIGDAGIEVAPFTVAKTVTEVSLEQIGRGSTHRPILANHDNWHPSSQIVRATFGID